MTEKQLKKCWWCTKEIKENEETIFWKKGKIIIQLHKKCSEEPDVKERLKKMYHK